MPCLLHTVPLDRKAPNSIGPFPRVVAFCPQITPKFLSNSRKLMPLHGPRLDTVFDAAVLTPSLEHGIHHQARWNQGQRLRGRRR